MKVEKRVQERLGKACRGKGLETSDKSQRQPTTRLVPHGSATLEHNRAREPVTR